MNKESIFTIFLFVIAVAGLNFILNYGNSAEGQYDSFARCLAEKEITMYGADWCSHCQAEKTAFGKSFQYIPYVECPENIPLCLERKITGYPTWIFADGRRLEGEQGLVNLARESGCKLIIN